MSLLRLLRGTTQHHDVDKPVGDSITNVAPSGPGDTVPSSLRNKSSRASLKSQASIASTKSTAHTIIAALSPRRIRRAQTMPPDPSPSIGFRGMPISAPLQPADTAHERCLHCMTIDLSPVEGTLEGHPVLPSSSSVPHAPSLCDWGSETPLPVRTPPAMASEHIIEVCPEEVDEDDSEEEDPFRFSKFLPDPHIKTVKSAGPTAIDVSLASRLDDHPANTSMTAPREDTRLRQRNAEGDTATAALDN